MGTLTSVATGKPRPTDFNQAATPLAASNPMAEPPLSTTACTSSTRFAGCRASVSRVPGAPPRQSIAATAGSSGITTVVPLINFMSCACPTLIPDTSVMLFLGPGCILFLGVEIKSLLDCRWS